MADRPIEEIDSKVASALGKRVAEIASGLTVGKIEEGEEEEKIKASSNSK
jgi:hypothetical protein